MNSETKERLNAVLGLVRTVFQWGYIPAIIYLGKFPWLLIIVN